VSLRAPFPYFGGKSGAAAAVWARLGSPSHYIEPFAGSLAVLLARPGFKAGARQWTETVNDLDGLLCNFWRAVSFDADAVAEAADWPVNELDLHARHAHLIASRSEVTERLRTDPEWFDARLAGWYAWGAGAWIGSGWGSRASRQMPSISGGGGGIHAVANASRRARIDELRERLSGVRVLCGDWRRAVTKSACVAWSAGDVGVFLDPPYGEGLMDYSAGGNATGSVAADVWAWACEAWSERDAGRRPSVRICVAGYEDGRKVPAGWVTVEWDKPGAGYANFGTGGAKANAKRERLWFSPNCLNPDTQGDLFFCG
jgi:DNA adenine methylase